MAEDGISDDCSFCGAPSGPHAEGCPTQRRTCHRCGARELSPREYAKHDGTIGHCVPPGLKIANAKSPAEELRDLVAVMREMGVTEYERGDVRLKLGAAPRPESPPITEAQVRAAQEKAAKNLEDLTFASSEGFPIEEAAQ